MAVEIVVGAQWGDEGKGKWIDTLAEKADLVVRYQGGNNAGHTLYPDGQKLVLHHLPSGILHPGKICVLGAGMVINPIKLREEIDLVSKLIAVNPSRLKISGRAHVITPWHIEVDCNREQGAGRPIGTTKRGIGPTYASKAHRTGLRMVDFIQGGRRANWLKELSEEEPSAGDFISLHGDLWDSFAKAADFLKPFVCDGERLVRDSHRAGKQVLLEGAQGVLLDIDHGTYPFVTSSTTSAAGACQSLGLSPRSVSKVIGIAKAYVTRVGEGPLPTELKDEVGKTLGEKGNEFGATTGRPRRCGWLDGVALRYVCDINDLDGIVLNKMDILTGFPEIKLAVAYKHPSLGTIDYLPASAEDLKQCEPVYETFPGWSDPIPSSGKIADLPDTALRFIKRVEEFCGAPVIMVGTGPERADALWS